ncbi:PREDICTED: uncharacterized protein LOC109171699 [Ipomoea nil]|uniref:uncharacterized protein LOC109171699 n=1 Tax=Ipomoea nil TaxID=35883 RepID=UPI000901C048|nr:PREDICTED: uncharacterized protein LOC109171699 [Ipomoea nil]
MSGHTVDRCYKKHGFLPDWIQGYKTKNKQPVTTSVLNNSDLGITSEQLQKLISAFRTQQTQPSGPSSSNVTSAIALTPKFDELHTDSEDKFSINSFSLSSHTWILDSGATNNIVCSLDCLTNYHMVDEVKVNLPTGQCISVEHIGDAKLSENLCLKEALHIPSFKFNIVSVSKLIEDAAYTLTFMSKQCTIQGIHGQIVGLAKEENGLYILVEPKSQNKCYVMQCTSPELWHQRLGMPSPVINLSTPYQMLYGSSPDISSLRVFGCLSYAATNSKARHKMAPRGKRYIFLGFPAGIKGYLLYDADEGSTIISGDVTFYEGQFPMAEKDVLDPTQSSQPSLPNVPISMDIDLDDQ